MKTKELKTIKDKNSFKELLDDIANKKENASTVKYLDFIDDIPNDEASNQDIPFPYGGKTKDFGSWSADALFI